MPCFGGENRGVDAWTTLVKLWWCEKGYSGEKREGGREGRRREREGETTNSPAVDFPQVQLYSYNTVTTAISLYKWHSIGQVADTATVLNLQTCMWLGCLSNLLTLQLADKSLM